MPVFTALILISENQWSMDVFVHAKAYLIYDPHESSNCIWQEKNWNIPKAQAKILSGFTHIIHDFCLQLFALVGLYH